MIDVRALLPQRQDFTAMRVNPRRDIVAGVTVAVVALPLALAFGATSGLGAGAGLITAIVAGLAAAVFGGSNLQITGPTGAMTVVLIPVVAQFGPAGVLAAGAMAGLMLIGLAVAGAGGAIKYLPLPVIEGFTLGIAVVIGLQQVPMALGVSVHGEKVVLTAFEAIKVWLLNPHVADLVITLVVTASILIAARIKPAIPFSLVAVAIVTICTSVFALPVATIGTLPTSLPFPSLPNINIGAIGSLIVPAIAIAALGALESLLSATVADAMTVNEHHDPNRELFGQGIANVVTPLFGGVPATAAIARTAVNTRAGARSRLGAITQSVVLLVVILVAAPMVSTIPLAALAGVLFATVIQMIEISTVRGVLRSTRGDAVVLVSTALATIIFDLVIAVVIGLAIAGIYALSQVARSARIEELPVNTGSHADEEQALLDERIVAYRLDGPLFFGVAHSFLLELTEISDVRVVILRLSRIQTLDATGAVMLGETIKTLESRGISVMLSGIKAAHDETFRSLDVYRNLASERHIFNTTPEAIEHARMHVRREEHHSDEPSKSGR